MATLKPCPLYAELVAARLRLANKATEMPIRLPITPSTDHIEALRDDLMSLAESMNIVIRCYGEYLDYHSPSKVDLRLFNRVVTDALDGNATHEFQCAIEDMIEDAAEVA